MSRRACAILLLGAGIAATIVGADILLEVRHYLEHGPLAAVRRFAVLHIAAPRQELAVYQLPGILLVSIGPAAVLAAYLIWPRTGEASTQGDEPKLRRRRRK